MVQNSPGAGPGDGFWPRNSTCICTFTDGATAGDVVMFDLNNTETGAISPGDASVFSTVVDPADTQIDNTSILAYGFFGLAMTTVAAGAKGEVMTRGLFDLANVHSDTVAGGALIPAADGQMDVATATGAAATGTGFKIIAIALEADASNLAKVIFDGISGFGLDTEQAA